MTILYTLGVIEPVSIWFLIFIYAVGSGLQDLRTRKIKNQWNYAWFVLFVGFHIFTHTWIPSLVGSIVMLAVMFYPTYKGTWGVGDWKMSIVFGSAVGVLPTLIILLAGWRMMPLLKPRIYRLSLRYMPEDKARLIPLASLMSVSTALTSVIAVILQTQVIR